MKTASLAHYYRNARIGNIDAIAESLEVNGQYKPIVVNAGTHTGRKNEVLVGNHTLSAALQLGWVEIQAVVVDVDNAGARRIVLVDNRTSDLAGYDEEMLAGLLAEGDLAGTGFTEVDISGLLEPDVLTDPDDAPSVPAEPVTKPGDVWELGGSRLVCGSSTEADVIAALMGDDLADCMWTDPPYGVDYEGKRKIRDKIKNDGAAGLADMLHAAFGNARGAIRDGGAVYVAMPQGMQQYETYLALDASGFSLRQQLVWIKNISVIGRSDYHYKHEPIVEAEAAEEGLQHEPIAYGFNASKPGLGRLGRGGDRWHGDNKQVTVFEYSKPHRSLEHPTMKPVDLVRAMLANSCPPGGVVLDLFAGSGTTLIAAHMLGMRARLVELDPGYCDVIVKRWEALTGGKAVRVPGA